MCLLVVEICCVRALREAQCQRGIDRALASKPCPKGDSNETTLKDCCEGCQLGRMSSRLGVGCSLMSFRFGRPWDEAFAACCLHHPNMHPTTSSPVQVNLSSSVDDGNLCMMFPGRLCSHLCIPTGVNSFRCDCPLGHQLGQDQRTCYPEDPSARQVPFLSGHCGPGLSDEFAGDLCRCERENPCEQICQDAPDSGIQCLCNPGYQLADDRISCLDVDECVVGVDVCGSLGQACMNTPGSYLCLLADGSSVAPQEALGLPTPSYDDFGQNLDCPAGFSYDPNSMTCQDVDECVMRPGQLQVCGSGFQCQNTVGSFSCVLPEECPEGYVESSLDSSCLDVDECREGDGDCEEGEVCRNTLGGYECDPGCMPGFRIHPQLKICVDIDECRREEMHNCSHLLGEKCVNTLGSFTCERAASACSVGYEFNETRLQCQDVDECLEGACGVGEECVNTPGSFRCQARVSCEPGFKLQPRTRRCLVKLGCLDIDECADGSHDCPRDRTECVNTYGGYECKVLCLPGYRPSPATTNQSASTCIDVDECAEGTDLCLESEECVNTDGSYRCESDVDDGEPEVKGSREGDGDEGRENLPRCPNGFLYDPITRECRDVNECLGEDPCKGGNSSCINLPGGYRCDCPVGFQFNIRTKDCQDVNECQLELHNCQTTQRCDNTIGSFTCIRMTGCGTGYTLNAHTGLCEDDDECELGTSKCKELGPDWECENTQGSFRCIKSCPPGEETNERTNRCEPLRRTPPPPSCPSGYQTGPKGSCIDVDECGEGLHDCGGEQTCRNRVGGYVCECPVGYALDDRDGRGRSCRDVDECSLYRGQVCSGLNSNCVNLPGSYRWWLRVEMLRGEMWGVEDVDECKETPGICRHNCVNTWGSFQCSCRRGFVLSNDGRSCNDIDECSGRGGDRLCVGICMNEPGSYSCMCPEGGADVDECAEDPCGGVGVACVNVGGGYRCASITCPPGYDLDAPAKKCKRRNTRCIATDITCIRQPLSYSHYYISLPSNVEFMQGGSHTDLFMMRGASAPGIQIQFTLDHKSSRAPSSVAPASRNNFKLRHLTETEAGILLVRSIEGPQDVELQLTMDMIQSGRYVGSHIARVFIYVSRYEF
ncbi:unnamed protein product [Darwinula stevensoni]|uniref:EGF-like domain-containing protein n=1 Tax=Darwinula stevensoni TaxID=69355 RepID=A0A7R8X1E0_9CRUS|nr:unnamed protein product [Darwinula stevensoni]CAG0882699.1 unnamed protein product [Darwinula stevensoni]